MIEERTDGTSDTTTRDKTKSVFITYLLTVLRSSLAAVAHALVRAASALVPTPWRLFSIPYQVSRRVSTRHA